MAITAQPERAVGSAAFFISSSPQGGVSQRVKRKAETFPLTLPASQPAQIPHSFCRFSLPLSATRARRGRSNELGRTLNIGATWSIQKAPMSKAQTAQDAGSSPAMRTKIPKELITGVTDAGSLEKSRRKAKHRLNQRVTSKTQQGGDAGLRSGDAGSRCHFIVGREIARTFDKRTLLIRFRLSTP